MYTCTYNLTFNSFPALPFLFLSPGCLKLISVPLHVKISPCKILSSLHTPVKFYNFGPASSRALEDVKLCFSLSRAILCSSVSLSRVHINPSIHTPVLIHVCSSGLFFSFPFINVILV